MLSIYVTQRSPNPRPDEATAKLMEFIANRTPREAIFSGDSVITSMIKLLTRYSRNILTSMHGGVLDCPRLSLSRSCLPIV